MIVVKMPCSMRPGPAQALIQGGYILFMGAALDIPGASP